MNLKLAPPEAFSSTWWVFDLDKPADTVEARVAGPYIHRRSAVRRLKQLLAKAADA